RFDDLPVVKVATDGSFVCAGQVISLSGSVLNHNGGIWRTIANSNAYLGNGFIKPNTTTLGSVTYNMSAQDANQTNLRFVLTSLQNNNCAPVSDTATINLFARPTANAGSPSICTTSGIQLAGTATNTSQTVWTTSGTGVFSPSIFASNAVYIPSNDDLNNPTGTTLKFTAQGQGTCDEISSSILLPLVSNPLPVANAGQDQIICGGNPFRLNVVNLQSSNSYQWFEPSVVGINTILSPIGNSEAAVTVNLAGIDYYPYILSVVDNNSGCVNVDTIKLRSLILPPLDMPQQVCYADQLTLSVGASFTKREGKFQWYRDGAIQGNEIDPERIEVNLEKGQFAGYTLEYTEDGTICSILDTTVVRPLPILSSIGKVVCQNDIFSVTPIVVTIEGVNTNSYTYKWNLPYNYANNVERFTLEADTFLMKLRTLSDIAITRDSAKYLVQVTDPAISPIGCLVYDTLRVKTHPVPLIRVPDVNACIGDVVTLDATPSNLRSPITITSRPSNVSTVFNASYSWNYQGLLLTDTSQVYKSKIRIPGVSTLAGFYEVTFRIGECVRRDSSIVLFNDKPVVQNAFDVPYCIDDRKDGKGIELDAGAIESNPLKYLWLASGNTSQKEIVFDTLKYYVRISNLVGCSYIDSILVRPSCDPRVYFPEGLIPDGENKENRYFTIFGKYFDNVELSVFNRWGEIVFYSTDKDFIMNNGWDGNFGGSKLPTGVYPYTFKYYGLYKEQGGKQFEKRGSVTIIR
ncbi:MAG: gliding motility-associated C-terminal domain-containing protein, partial [Cytophagales bacterium]